MNATYCFPFLLDTSSGSRSPSPRAVWTTVPCPSSNRMRGSGDRWSRPRRSSGGCGRTCATAAAGELLAFGQRVVEAQRALPCDLSGVRVDGDQPCPWWALAGEIRERAAGRVLQRRAEREVRAGAVDAAAVVRAASNPRRRCHSSNQGACVRSTPQATCHAHSRTQPGVVDPGCAAPVDATRATGEPESCSLVGAPPRGSRMA